MDTLRRAVMDRWPAITRSAADVRVVRAPGRINLIGEHTDYNDGLVLPAAINLEIRVAYVNYPGQVELVGLDDGRSGSFRLPVGRPPDGSWLDYPAGVAHALQVGGYPIAGLKGVIATTLPMNAGLSSSAAFELASAWALLGEAVFAVDPVDLARLAQRAENDYVGVACGLMDQFAAACGRRDAALLLDCRSLEWRAVALPSDVEIVVCDTGSSRRLTDSEYNARRAQCEAAVATIATKHPTVRSLRDVTVAMLDDLRDDLDPVSERRARHVVAENERVKTTVAALESGDLDTVADAFAASHRSLRDLFEVSSPELDALVEIATSVPGVVASRMTGAGFGGCTVNLVRPDAVGALTDAVERDYPGRTALRPRVIPVRAADGASVVLAAGSRHAA